MNDVVLVIRAAAFAAEKHRNQRRTDAEASPYINHPLALAAILAGEGHVTDPITLAAALLHDTIEDTETSFAELEREFGPEIASIVAEVTDDKSLPRAERKRLQVVRAASKSPRAKLIKLADKLANLRDMATAPPVHWPLERRQAYFDWAAEVAVGLKGVHDDLEAAFAEAHAKRPLDD